MLKLSNNRDRVGSTNRSKTSLLRSEGVLEPIPWLENGRSTIRKLHSWRKTQTWDLRGSHSKFAILSDITEEEEVVHSIETLKQKIKDLPGPSNTYGPVHEKKQGKLGQQNSSLGGSKN